MTEVESVINELLDSVEAHAGKKLRSGMVSCLTAFDAMLQLSNALALANAHQAAKFWESKGRTEEALEESNARIQKAREVQDEIVEDVLRNLSIALALLDEYQEAEHRTFMQAAQRLIDLNNRKLVSFFMTEK